MYFIVIPLSRITNSSTTSQCSKPVDITKLEADGMFHSQDSQDKCLLQHYFPNLCHGRYLEVGSGDGDKQSNTYALYNLQDIGWRGVNVEVDPVNYEKLIDNRKDDTNVHASTFCSESQEVIHYAKPKADDEVGGLWEYSTPEQRNQWWHEYTLDLVPVQCTPLQDIIDEAAIDTTDKQYFDFMSLNIEDVTNQQSTSKRFAFALIQHHDAENLLWSSRFNMSSLHRRSVRNRRDSSYHSLLQIRSICETDYC